MYVCMHECIHIYIHTLYLAILYYCTIFMCLKFSHSRNKLINALLAVCLQACIVLNIQVCLVLSSPSFAFGKAQRRYVHRKSKRDFGTKETIPEQSNLRLQVIHLSYIQHIIWRQNKFMPAQCSSQIYARFKGSMKDSLLQLRIWRANAGAPVFNILSILRWCEHHSRHPMSAHK